MSQKSSEPAAHDAAATASESPTGTGNRTDGNLDLSLAPTNFNNVLHQRRRVNPESLALRLGPDLVRDLDALITPGNTEMPSFAVRRELQERYSIDRRHIYDYFHSRGLRVVKEDKHGNPMTVKDVPTSLPNLRPLRQAPNGKTSRSHPIAAETKLFKPRGVTKAKPGRPRKLPPVNNPKMLPDSCETSESTGTNNAAASEPPPSPVSTSAYVSVNPFLPDTAHAIVDEDCAFNSVANPLDESFSVKRAIGDIAYAYRHKLVFDRMQELVEHPVRPALTDDRSLLWSDMSPCSASAKGLLVPHAQPLSWDERQAIYENLSDSLGPPHGIQECQGTYRKHMEARSKLYFEGLQAVPYHHSQQPAKPTCVIMDRKAPCGTSEFRHWLSETRFLKRDSINDSPRLQPSYRNPNAAKQEDDKRGNYNPHRMQTLDELFPVADALSTDTTADSPVIHTRQVTRMTAHVQDFSASSGDVKTRVEEDCPGHVIELGLGPSDFQRKSRTLSRNARIRVPSYSPRKRPIRDLDRIWTRPMASCDARRRTPSATGDI